MQKKLISLIGAVLCAVMLCSCATTSKGGIRVKDIYETSKHLVLGQYKGVEVTVSTSSEVTDADVEDAKNKVLLEKKVSSDTVEGRVSQKWDTVNIIYTAYVDGEETESSTTPQDITIGAGSFLEDFENQLVGFSSGETKTIDVTFPESWSSSTVAGKTVSFSVTVNSITENVFPAFDDEFVFQNFGYGTVSEFYEQYPEKLESERLEQVNSEKKEAAWDVVLANCTVTSMPSDTYAEYTSQAGEYYNRYASYYSMTSDQVASNAAAQAKSLLTDEMVAYAILVKEKIEITADDQQRYKQTLISQSGYADESEFTASTGQSFVDAYGGEAYAEKYYAVQKAMEFCGEKAVIAG